MRRITMSQIRNARTMGQAFGRVSVAMGQQFARMVSTAARFSRRMVNVGVQRLGSLAAATAKWGSATVAGLGAGTIALNHSTTEAQRLSKAMGLNVELVEAFESSLNGTSFNLENIIDLAEELANKMGESKKTGLTESLKGGLKTLGLKYGDIKNLSPEAQFTKLFDTALKMKDRQAAASGLDQIMGGEANKVFSVLADRAKSTGDLIKAYRALNFQTEESRRGAMQFTDQLSSLTGAIISVGKFAAGILGERIQAKLGELTKYLETQKATVQKWVTETVDAFVEQLPKALDAVKKLVQSLIDHGPQIEQTVESILRFLEGLGTVWGYTLGGLGEWLGETAAKAVVGQGAQDAEASRKAYLERKARGELSYLSSPQERTARMIQERNSTTTTQVELVNRTGMATVTRGPKAQGFRMVSTGALA
jgi:uncharacterized protein YukE